MAGFTIGKVAGAAGVGVETVRFYQRRGLIEEPMPLRTSFREYPTSVVDRIRFIKQAQDLGFTLAEVQELLELCDRPGASRGEARTLATTKLGAIRQKISDLQRMESTLAQLVEQCSGHGPLPGCPIIEALIGSETKVQGTRKDG